jgi:mannosylglycerate hydrolase
VVRRSQASAHIAPVGAPSPLPPGDWRFVVVPHTHWDREWYQTFEHFRIRMARTFDEVVDVLGADPRLRFTLDGQCVLLEDYAEVRDPAAVTALLELIRAGRVSVGPAYVLPDEYLVGGEALVRNLLVGARVCRRLGIPRALFGYQPDTFGNIAQLPQILRGFGIDHCLFMRGLGDEAGELGALFDWKAPDGSTVLAVRLLDGYGHAATLGMLDAHDKAIADPARWPEAACERVSAHLARWADVHRRSGLADVLLCNGVDHKRIQRNLPEILDALRSAYPGHEFEVGTYADYVERLRGARPAGRHVGELCGGRLHTVTRGVNSARLWIKQANAATEAELAVAETVACLGRLAGRYPYPDEELLYAWRQLLRCQPHDSIGGCSIDQVHEDMRPRFESARQVAGRVTEEALVALAHGPWHGWWHYADPPGSQRTAINPLPYDRSCVVELDGGPRAWAMTVRADGRPIPCQLDADDRTLLASVPLAPFGSASVEIVSGARTAPGDAGAHGEFGIANRHYVVVAEADGTLAVTDRRTGATHRGLLVFEDQGDRGDSYNAAPLGDVVTTAVGHARRRVTATGPVVAELTVDLRLDLPGGLAADDRSRRVGAGAVELTVRVRLHHDEDLIRFDLQGRNDACDHRLRALFAAPEADAADGVRAEGQFAVLHRPCRPPTGAGWKEPPQPTHHTAGAVAAGRLALFGDGLPEYEALPGADGGVTLAITLLRCFGWLSRDDNPLRPYGAGPEIPTPAAQEQGPFAARFALRLGSLSDAELARTTQALRTGALVGPAGARTHGLLRLDGDGWAFGALKRAEESDRLVLRLYNPGAAPAVARVGGALAAAGLRRVRLDETDLGPQAGAAVELAPYEIVSLALPPATPEPPAPFEIGPGAGMPDRQAWE